MYPYYVFWIIKVFLNIYPLSFVPLITYGICSIRKKYIGHSLHFIIDRIEIYKKKVAKVTFVCCEVLFIFFLYSRTQFNGNNFVNRHVLREDLYSPLQQCLSLKRQDQSRRSRLPSSWQKTMPSISLLIQQKR